MTKLVNSAGFYLYKLVMRGLLFGNVSGFVA